MNSNLSEVILLIFNCKRYKYKAEKQNKTWLKELSTLNSLSVIPYFHVIGDPNITNDYIFDTNNHTLIVKVADDYNSLPKKVIAAYEAVNKEYIFNYIFKTDDDQNLVNIKFLHLVRNILSNRLPKIHYGGKIINVDEPYLSEYHTIHPELPKSLPILTTKYCSGRFYILSDLAVQQLLSKKELISKEYLEDYAIGYYLDPILKKNTFNIETNKYFIDFEEYD